MSIMSRITAPAGDVTMPIRLGMEEVLFAGGIEEAFECKPPLQLLEGILQRPVALRLERLYQKLVASPRGEDIESAAREHLHAVLRLESKESHAVPEADAL